MIRGASKLLKAESEEDVLNRPEIKTYYMRILDALKEAEDGLTNHEICVKLNLPERRRASERISKMKDEGIVFEKRCRCGHAPIYYFYK